MCIVRTSTYQVGAHLTVDSFQCNNSRIILGTFSETLAYQVRMIVGVYARTCAELPIAITWNASARFGAKHEHMAIRNERLAPAAWYGLDRSSGHMTIDNME
jgi:hypothetical protein